MFDTERQFQRFDQKNIIHKRSSASTAAPHVEKVSRHRSLETNKKRAQRQSTSIVHVSVRQPKINQPNNNKSANPPEFIQFSTILNSRYQQNKLKQPSLNKSLSACSKYMTHPLNETNVSSRHSSLLQTTQNAWDNNDLRINSKKKKNDLINAQERINNSPQQRYELSTIPRTLVVNSFRSDPAQHVLQISNESNVIINSQRPNKLDFVREYCNFSNRKQLKNNRNQHRKNCCWPSSCCCIVGCILGILLVGVVVSAIVVGLLTKQKPTTTTTTTTTTPTTITTATIITTTTTTASTTTSTMTTTESTTSITTTMVTVTTTISSTTTSSRTTSSTTTSRTTTSSTAISRTTTTTSSTTTTPIYCGQSCLNQSWINSSSDLALWPFDGSYIDITGSYNATPSLIQPTFDTGYFDQACSFNVSLKQAMYTSFIPLNNISFTIEAWIKPTGYPNSNDEHSIVELCPTKTSSRCLHISIRDTKLYFGFYGNDAQGAKIILLNQWIHTAFVFDVTKKIQTIYLNGFQDGLNSGSNALLVTSGNFTIGMNEHVMDPNNYYQGYMDHLSINRRAKSSCEILEIATLAAHFEFDSASPYTNSGPNAVATASSTTSIISGYKNQAISFSGSSTSYFQAWGFTSLGISNQAFSITFWIKPQILSGTLVHLSSSSSGNGSTCFPLLGFASNRSIVAQVLTNNATIVTTIGPILPVSLSWIPVVQTWSATNGLKLYVNNTLVNPIAASTFKGSGITPNYLTLGNCLSGCSVCSSGLIGSPGPFIGAIDDWRIYNRELTSMDVCTLFSTT